MVGDSKVDETMANRMQMQFIHADEFWRLAYYETYTFPDFTQM